MSATCIEIGPMKNFFVFVLFLALLSCSADSTNRNPYLQEIGFTIELNLNLPLYSNLNSLGNPVYVGNAGVGTRGAFVMRVGQGNDAFSFIAFEASCPNHAPNSCSTMELDGQNAVCPCEGYTYSLFTGQQLDRPDDGQRYYDLLFYRVTPRGNSVVISN